MPSIFSRSSTTGKKNKPIRATRHVSAPIAVDEWGAARPTGPTSRSVSAGNVGRDPSSHVNNTRPVTDTGARLALPPPTNVHAVSPPPLLPIKYAFLPTCVPPDPSWNATGGSGHSTDEETRQYGFLGGVGAKVALGIDDVGQVLDAAGKELVARGLSTPMIFSNQALELSQIRTKMLIEAYLRSVSSNAKSHTDDFVRDLAFASLNEVAWFLRWALARITRVRDDTHEVCHGVLDWEVYEEWRGRERAASYRLEAFPFLSTLLPAGVYERIVAPLFRLLSRFAANSHLSGLTPHALSSLFAPLLFPMPASASAMEAHTAFVRAASATEHLLLAYIRSTGIPGSLGVADLPYRLKEWVSGYPAMIASDADLARGAPRKGARVIRCERATRLVRAYSKDLVMQAETWAQDVALGGSDWAAWRRVTWEARRGDISRPKFAPAYRHRMMVKEVLPLSSLAEVSGLAKPPAKAGLYGTMQKPGLKDERRLSGAEENEDGRWSSLAGQAWSIFEEGGFDAPLLTLSANSGRSVSDGGSSNIKDRLQFDLTESAKMSIAERRRTMDWSEFAAPSGGFNRTNPVLDVSLALSEPVEKSIVEWPNERAELQRRLQKAQKEAVPFNHDTTARVGTEAIADPYTRTDEKGRVYLEEAFVDCWADLMLGAGWVERDELTFRQANWALIEYKARTSRPELLQDNDPLSDPRRTELYFLFEERVPLDYQQALLAPNVKKSPFGLFSSRYKRRSAGVSPDPSSHDQVSQLGNGDNNEFEKMLLQRNHTKKLTLTKSASDHPHSTVVDRDGVHGGEKSPARTRFSHRSKSGSRPDASTTHETDSEEKSGPFLRMRRSRRDLSKNSRERQHEQNVEFELHSASGVSSAETSPRDGSHSAGSNGKSEDKWMDILIANGAKRMDMRDVPPVIPLARAGLPGSNEKVSSAVPDRPLTPETVPSHVKGSRETSHENESAMSIRRKRVPTTTMMSSEDTYSSWSGSGTGSGSLEPASPRSNDSRLTYQYHGQQPLRVDDSFGGRGHPATWSEDGYTHSAEPALPELLHPSPRKSKDSRDTIHGIVDHYQRDSSTSDLLDGYEGEGDSSQITDGESMLELAKEVVGEQATSRQLHPHPFEPGSGGVVTRDPTKAQLASTPLVTSQQDDGPHLLSSGSRRFPFEPPDKGMLFDLTPGREPSPARYKHGEPLHFVGEEEEEYEYETEGRTWLPAAN
ncbi:hypothetical protein IAU60_005384 [Kwoniella sp. DSM 27419]